MARHSAALRVAIYARVSTGEQTARNQTRELRAYAQRRGWKIAHEYVDEGVSGAKASRPTLDRLMADAKKGAFGVVLVWRFDRFPRSTTHLLSALEEFRVLGIDFVSLQESIDTGTPMGRMVFTICAAVAELERSLIREPGDGRAGKGAGRGQGAGAAPQTHRHGDHPGVTPVRIAPAYHCRAGGPLEIHCGPASKAAGIGKPEETRPIIGLSACNSHPVRRL
ncbi:MAG: recombinase family protein [Planctomycetes bacterium]|nr:recombinase family protein [Planctomycetota bacterium]